MRLERKESRAAYCAVPPISARCYISDCPVAVQINPKKNNRKEIKMITLYDREAEYPPRMYRLPEEICSDIRRVGSKLKEINDMLNVRNIIAEVISEDSREEPLRRIEAVNELLDYAKEALSEMRELEEGLDGLKEELFDALCSGNRGC